MKTKKRWCIAGIVIGAILALGPAWGALGTVVGMIYMLNNLGKTGITHPDVIANNVTNSLMVTATGYILCPVGLGILVVSIIFYNRIPKNLPSPLPVARV